MSAFSIPESILESGEFGLEETDHFALQTYAVTQGQPWGQFCAAGQRMRIATLLSLLQSHPIPNYVPGEPPVAWPVRDDNLFFPTIGASLTNNITVYNQALLSLIIATEPLANVPDDWQVTELPILGTLYPPLADGSPLLIYSILCKPTDLSTYLTPMLTQSPAGTEIQRRGICVYPNTSLASEYLWDNAGDGNGAAIGISPTLMGGTITTHSDLGAGMLSAPLTKTKINPVETGTVVSGLDTWPSDVPECLGFPPGIGPLLTDYTGNSDAPPLFYQPSLSMYHNYASPNKIVILWPYQDEYQIPSDSFNPVTENLLVIK